MGIFLEDDPLVLLEKKGVPSRLCLRQREAQLDNPLRALSLWADNLFGVIC